MTLEQALSQVALILQAAYDADPNIRHAPLYRAIQEWSDQVETAVYQAEDAAMDEAIDKWRSTNK